MLYISYSTRLQIFAAETFTVKNVFDRKGMEKLRMIIKMSLIFLINYTFGSNSHLRMILNPSGCVSQ